MGNETSLSKLVSNTAPEYKNTRLRGAFIRLTIGDLISRTPGIIDSISLSWKTDYPWEIKLDSKGKDGPNTVNGPSAEMLVLPHVLDVQMSFTPIHTFLPQKSIEKSPFILPEKSSWLTRGNDPWGPQPATEEEMLETVINAETNAEKEAAEDKAAGNTVSSGNPDAASTNPDNNAKQNTNSQNTDPAALPNTVKTNPSVGADGKKSYNQRQADREAKARAQHSGFGGGGFADFDY